MAGDYRKKAEEFAHWLVSKFSGQLQEKDGEVRGRCPIPGHEDKSASFGYSIPKDAFACSCSNGKGLNLRLSLGYTKERDPSKAPLATYDYHNERGDLLFQVVKFPGKKFLQRRKGSNGKWVWNLKGVERVPYGLPDLIAGKGQVLVLEGEKDVRSTRKLGFTATCNPGGAGKWRGIYDRWFQGRDVVIIPDNDDAGEKHSADVAKALHGTAKSIKVVRLPVPPKGDLSDWVQSGGTAETLTKLIEGTGPYEPPKEDPKEDPEKKDEPGGTEGIPGFDDGNWRPQLMASFLVSTNHLLATPVAKDGRAISLHLYKNGVYRPGAESIIRKWIQEMLGKYTTDGRLNEVLSLAKETAKVDYERINPKAKTLINVRNGMLDWETGKLYEHDPKYLSTFQINATYDPNAKSEALDKFLEFILPEDAIALVLEFIGYLLLPETSLEKCFVAVGPGGNGKGTLLRIVMKLLGKSNVSAISIHDLCEHRFALPSIMGKLANICYDMESGYLERSANFKQIVSGDTMTGEEKRKAMFEFEPFARLMFSTNEFPRTRDRSQAFLDRLLFVPFDRRIRGSKDCIPKFEEKVLDEAFLSALLRRAVDGLRQLMKRGKFEPGASHQTMIDDYKSTNNSVYNFVSETCSFSDPTGWLTRRELYKKYTSWCLDYGYKKFSSKEFCREMRSFNIEEKKLHGSRGWTGISWSEDGEPTSHDEIKSFGKSEATNF